MYSSMHKHDGQIMTLESLGCRLKYLIVSVCLYAPTTKCTIDDAHSINYDAVIGEIRQDRENIMSPVSCQVVANSLKELLYGGVLRVA